MTMKLLKFLRGLFALQQPERVTLRRLVGVVPTSNEWRKNDKSVGSAARILATPEMQMLLNILENERPARTHLPDSAQATDIVRAYAFNAGYEAAIAAMRSLGEPALEDAEPPETFVDDLTPHFNETE